MPTLDASTPTAVYADTAGLTALTTASFTPPSGSIVVAHVVTADVQLVIASVTSTGPTFTARVPSHGTTGHGAVAIYTATATGAAITVSANFSGTSDDRGLIVSVFTGAQLAATPATNVADSVSTGAPSSTITTAAANSVVTWVEVDWSAVDGTTRTYRSSATETSYHRLAGGFADYAAYQAAATAGSQTYGLTAPTGQTWTLAAVEIQASGGGAAAKPYRLAVLQAVNRAANF